MVEAVGEPTEYINVFAYATDSERYRRDLVEDSKASTTLEIVGKGHSKLRSVEMNSPVKQVLNCFIKSKDVRKVLCFNKINYTYTVNTSFVYTPQF